MKQTRTQGFTLLEMALVMAVLGLLLSGIVSPLATARERLDRSLARQQLQRVEVALVGHLLARGRLPCAASRTSGGQEERTADGCSAFAGFVPAVALGIQGPLDGDGVLLDRWNRPLLYRLSTSDSDLDTRPDYAVTDGVRLQSPLLIRADNTVQQAVDAACGRVAPRADAVVAVVLSQGRFSARSAAERENIDNDPDFTSRAISDTAACAFDDQMVWLTENRVLTLLLQAGVLPRQ